MQKIQGSFVAIVTPMKSDGTVDYDSFEELIEWHIDQGSNAIVTVGTTGESTTLSFEEHNEVVKFVVNQTRKRIPVIAGTGSNNTKEAIFLSQFAKDCGADMSLSVVPYYNKPSQQGMIEHFSKIAQSVDLPMILYNVPGRTVVDMSNDTIVELSKIDNIVGIKEATGNITRACNLIQRLPKDFMILSGDDSTAMAFMLCGGDGIISVTANLAPRDMAKMCKAAIDKDFLTAKEINDKLQKLHRDVFCEPSPTPTKWALKLLGKCDSFARLPMVPLSSKGEEKISSALKEAGLI